MTALEKLSTRKEFEDACRIGCHACIGFTGHHVAPQGHTQAGSVAVRRLHSAIASAQTVTRIPVTVGVLTMLLSMGIITGTLWHAADPTSAVLTPFSFGAPRLLDGRPWTFATGVFVQPGPEWYIVAVMLCIGLAAYERRPGSLRTAVALFGTQLAATLSVAALLWPGVNQSWAWAASLANQVDVGISAGVFGVLGASTAIFSQSWRRGVRLCAFAYLSVMVLRSGLLPDVEQLLGFGAGVLLGPILGRRPRLRLRPSSLSGLPVRVVASVLVASMTADRPTWRPSHWRSAAPTCRMCVPGRQPGCSAGCGTDAHTPPFGRPPCHYS